MFHEMSRLINTGEEGRLEELHQKSATKFQESRAFVRSNFKSKNFNPENNPLEESTSEEEEAVEVKK